MLVWIQNPFDNLPLEGYRKHRYWLMAEAFVAAGHRVVYWTSDFSHATKRKREFKAGEQERDFRIVLLPTRPYSRNIGIRRVVSHREYARTWERSAEREVAIEGERPNVIVVALPPVSIGLAGVALARKFKAKLIVDLQDAWPETFYRLLPIGLRWSGRFLFAKVRQAVRDVCRAADLVTGVCDRYEALVKEYGAKNYRRAYLGISLSDLKLRPQSDSRVLRLVYIGNLGVSYDLKTVIAGVRSMNGCQDLNVTLDVAGFGGLVATDGAVRFHGMLGQEDLLTLLLNCDIGIIPMDADSFVGVPNKLAEYAAVGLRVVSSLQGEVARMLADYRCGETYSSGDVQSFMVAVQKAAALERESARRMCEEEFDAVKIYADYVMTVEKLI